MENDTSTIYIQIFVLSSSRIQTTSPFKEAGPFNEMVVMGVLAIRLQSLNQELLWDGLNIFLLPLQDTKTPAIRL